MTKKTFMKKFAATPAVILILILIIASGCSKNPESETAKTGNANQAPTVSANNNSMSVNAPVNTPPPPLSVENNAPPATANKSKNATPPAKEPTPIIGSGESDMLLFTQARGALSADDELKNAVIIELKEGSAVLTGKVSSEAQKTKAAQLVQAVKGIRSVKNNLQVSR